MYIFIYYILNSLHCTYCQVFMNHTDENWNQKMLKCARNLINYCDNFQSLVLHEILIQYHKGTFSSVFLSKHNYLHPEVQSQKEICPRMIKKTFAGPNIVDNMAYDDKTVKTISSNTSHQCLRLTVFCFFRCQSLQGKKVTSKSHTTPLGGLYRLRHGLPNHRSLKGG